MLTTSEEKPKTDTNAQKTTDELTKMVQTPSQELKELKEGKAKETAEDNITMNSETNPEAGDVQMTNADDGKTNKTTVPTDLQSEGMNATAGKASRNGM